MVYDALQSKSKNVWGSFKIRIPFCNKRLIDTWFKYSDGKTKYGQTCNLNFDKNGYFFDTGVPKGNNKQPEWFWNDRLYNGQPLKFKVKTDWIMYGDLRSRRIDNSLEEIEVTGNWYIKFDNDRWKRVGARK